MSICRIYLDIYSDASALTFFASCPTILLLTLPIKQFRITLITIAAIILISSLPYVQNTLKKPQNGFCGVFHTLYDNLYL